MSDISGRSFAQEYKIKIMESLVRYYLPVKILDTIWEQVSALGRNNTDKVSQEIQYQTAALFTTYSGGGASVSLSIGRREALNYPRKLS